MDKKEPTQQTQPKSGEPITIPVPPRDEIDAVISKVAQPIASKPKKKQRKSTEDEAARQRARKRSGEGV
jgi:hypothetical protein